MKLIYGVLFFFSVVFTVTEFVKKKYLKIIKVSLNVEEHFERDRFFYINDDSYSTNNICSTCNYVFTGVLEKNKDTSEVIGPRHKIRRLFKTDDVLKKRYLDVWYCKHIDQISYIKKNADDEKPTFFSYILLEGWIIYFIMFCSIPLGVLLFKKEKKEDTAEV